MKASSSCSLALGVSGRATTTLLWSALILNCIGLAVIGLLANWKNSSGTESEAQVEHPPQVGAASAQPETTVGISVPVQRSQGEKMATPGYEVALSTPAPATLELVESLTRLEATGGVLTEVEAAAWTQKLAQLTAEGAEAVPAIREFLVQYQSQDLDFTAIPGWESLGHPSLRMALLDALTTIGGPEAEAVLVETMRSTAVPAEVAFLARTLEREAPGRYWLETVEAISAILGMAGQGQMTGWDVRPLFQVLQEHGGKDAVEVLAGARSEWKYYASIALASLPAGEGVSALVRQAKSTGPHDAAIADLGLRLLSQAAAYQPDAAAVLLENATEGRIPDHAWAKVVAGLVGDQYAIGGKLQEGHVQVSNVVGAKVYYVAKGNQQYYSVPLQALASTEEIDRRRGLIDQLLSVTRNPGATEALQIARNRLTNLLATK